MRPNETQKLYEQNEKTTYWMGENIYKSYNLYRINAQHIRTADTT